MTGKPSTALDQLEAELFRDAREQLEPDQARVDRLWRSVATASALGAAVGGVSGSVPPASGVGWAAPRPSAALPDAALSDAALPPPAAAAPAVATGSASFGLRALALAAVGGALVGFAAGYGAGGAQNAHEPPRAAAMVSSQADPAPSPASQVAEAADATPDAASGRTEEPQAPTALPGKSAKPRAPSSIEPSPSEQGPEPPKPSFYEELQYLKRAQSALRQGNGALALGLMTELDSVQPGGALLSERGVTQVLAHCLLGDVESAGRVAERLAAGGLASVYAERLEKSCAGAVLPKP